MSRTVLIISLTTAAFICHTGFADDSTHIVGTTLENVVIGASGDYTEWYNGFYLSLSVGPTGREAADDEGGIVDFDVGVVGNVGVGYKFPETSVGNIRMEVEWSRFHNTANDVFLKAISTKEDFKDTSIDINAFMANIFYDFKIGESKLKPYIGLGAGFSQGIIDDWETDTLNNLYNVWPTIPDASGNMVPNPYLGRQEIPMNQDSSYVGAIQFRAGINYQLTENLDCFAGYRFMRTDNFEVMFDGLPNRPYAQFHACEFGLRYTF